MAFRLPSAGNYVRWTTNLPSQNSYTVCGWFTPVATATSGSVIQLSYSGTPDYHQMSYDVTNSKFVGGTSYDYTGYDIRTGISAGTPVFVAITSSGVGIGTVKMYVGVSGDTALTSTTYSNNTWGGAPNELAFLDCYSNEPTNGRITDIKVYDTALTSDQLVAQMARMLPVSYSSLRMWIPSLSGTLSDALKDYSGNGYDLSAVGTPTIEDNPPIPYGAPVQAFASGLSSRIGTFNNTLSNLTLSSGGTISTAGSLNATMPNLTLSSSGGVLNVGSLSKTIDNFTVYDEAYDPNTISYGRSTGKKTFTDAQTSSTFSFPTGLNPTAGNSVVLTISGYTRSPSTTTFSVSSVSDNYGNVYTKIASVYDATQRTGSEIWASYSVASGSGFSISLNYTDVASYSGSGANQVTVQGDEFRNLRASGQPDQTATNNGTGPSTATTGTTASALELVVSVASNYPTRDGSSATVTHPAGYRQLWEEPLNSRAAGAADFKVVTSVGTQAAAYDFTTNTGNIGVAVATFVSSFPAIGTATPTLGNISLSSTGNPVAGGSLSKTLDNVVGGATTTVLTHGSLSSTLSNISSSSTGTVSDVGSLSKSIGTVALTGVANQLVTGSATNSIGSLSLTATSTNTVGGTVSKVLDNISISSSGTNLTHGSASPTLSNVTLNGAGGVSNTGSLTRTLDTIALAGNTSVIATNTLSKTLDNLTVSSTAQDIVTGTLSKTLSNVTLSSTVISDFHASGVSGFSNVTLSSTATNSVTGTGASNFGNIALGADVQNTVASTLSQNVGNVTVSSTGNPVVSGTLTSTLDNITVDGVAYRQIAADLSASFSNIALSSSVATPALGTVLKSLGTVTLSSAGTIGTSGTLNSIVNNITSSGAGAVSVSGVSTPTVANVTSSSTAMNLVSANGVNGFSNVTLGAAGSVSNSGALVRTLDPVTLSANINIASTAQLSSALDNITLLGVGFTNVVTVGTLNTQLDTFGFTSSATNPIAGTFNPSTIGDITLSSSSTVSNTSVLSTSIGNLSLTAPGTVSNTATSVNSLDNITLSGYAFSTTFANANNSIGSLSGSVVGTVGGTAVVNTSVGSIGLSSAGVGLVNGVVTPNFGDFTLITSVESNITGSLSVSIDAVVPSVSGGVLNRGALDTEFGVIAINATTRPIALAELIQTIDNFTLDSAGLQIITATLERSIGNITLNARQPTLHAGRYEFPPNSGNFLTYPSVDGYSPTVTRIVVTAAGSFAVGVDQYIELKDRPPKLISDLQVGDVIKTQLVEINLEFKNLSLDSVSTQAAYPTSHRILYLKVESLSEPGHYSISTSITPTLAGTPTVDQICSCMLVQRPDGLGCGHQFYITVNS